MTDGKRVFRPEGVVSLPSGRTISMHGNNVGSETLSWAPEFLDRLLDIGVVKVSGLSIEHSPAGVVLRAKNVDPGAQRRLEEAVLKAAETIEQIAVAFAEREDAAHPVSVLLRNGLINQANELKEALAGMPTEPVSGQISGQDGR